MAAATDNLIAKLEEMAAQYAELEASLADPQVMSNPERLRVIGIRRAALQPLVEQYEQWRKLRQQIEENREIIEIGEDPELTAMAREELPELEKQATELIESVSGEMVTADDRAIGAVMLEIRAGTGGAEAALWAGDLLQAYQAYIAANGWTIETLDMQGGEQGGLRHGVFRVAGDGAWQGLGYEGGVHCVKRVPATESQGRIHTSTATVAVLPEPEDVELTIDESEVEIHVTTAQGPGGQNVNKVSTAVHMIHKPTGIEVRMQETKSQHQNRQKAWQLLRARLYEHYQKQKDAERAEQRSKMIGSGGRSERVRTYRYKDNLVVDHRLQQQNFNLQNVLAGDFGPIVEALIREDRLQRLAAL